MRTLEPYWGLVEAHDGTYTIFRGERIALMGTSRALAEDYVRYRWDMEPGLVTLWTQAGKKNITKHFRHRKRRLWPWRKRPELVRDYQGSL